jgi:hypothetical protein
MKSVLAYGMICLVAIVAGCSGGVTAKQDFEPSTDFKLYKTWWWLQDSPTEKAVAASSDTFVKEYDAYFKGVVENEMTAKGLTRVQTNPDIRVSYMVGMKGTTGGINWDMDYLAQVQHAEVYKSSGGVVIIDFVDARSGELIWRGTGTGPTNIDPTPNMVKEEVNNVVKKILGQYPPK